jgi:hypothetical protein
VPVVAAVVAGVVPVSVVVVAVVSAAGAPEELFCAFGRALACWEVPFSAVGALSLV